MIVRLKTRIRTRKSRAKGPQSEIEAQMNRAEPFFIRWYEESVSLWQESEAARKGIPPPVPLERVENAFILDGTVYFPSGYDRKEAAQRYRNGEFGSLDGAYFFVNHLGGKTHLNLRPFQWEKLKLG